ncbi:hypothetical protein [Nocardia sp. NPDC047038]|uniref:hypothetical protein n=1 Tax=Nocardia sp. NPDC047038 TaxID=3154338 RepID=UPI0033C22A6C
MRTPLSCGKSGSFRSPPGRSVRDSAVLSVLPAANQVVHNRRTWQLDGQTEALDIRPRMCAGHVKASTSFSTCGRIAMNRSGIGGRVSAFGRRRKGFARLVEVEHTAVACHSDVR